MLLFHAIQPELLELVPLVVEELLAGLEALLHCGQPGPRPTQQNIPHQERYYCF